LKEKLPTVVNENEIELSFGTTEVAEQFETEEKS